MRPGGVRRKPPWRAGARRRWRGGWSRPRRARVVPCADEGRVGGSHRGEGRQRCCPSLQASSPAVATPAAGAGCCRAAAPPRRRRRGARRCGDALRGYGRASAAHRRLLGSRRGLLGDRRHRWRSSPRLREAERGGSSRPRRPRGAAAGARARLRSAPAPRSRSAAAARRGRRRRAAAGRDEGAVGAAAREAAFDGKIATIGLRRAEIWTRRGLPSRADERGSRTADARAATRKPRVQRERHRDGLAPQRAGSLIRERARPRRHNPKIAAPRAGVRARRIEICHRRRRRGRRRRRRRGMSTSDRRRPRRTLRRGSALRRPAIRSPLLLGVGDSSSRIPARCARETVGRSRLSLAPSTWRTKPARVIRSREARRWPPRVRVEHGGSRAARVHADRLLATRLRPAAGAAAPAAPRPPPSGARRARRRRRGAKAEKLTTEERSAAEGT